MGLFDAISPGMGSVLGAGIMGIGSYLGTQQTNAQSAANLWTQMDANSMLMDQQTLANWGTMDRQFDMNSRLMDKQAGINSAAAQWAFDRSQDQFKEVRDYNTTMANTAYQRMSADMRAAGLNPILGVASGGAGSPPISANSVSAPSVGSSGVGSPGTGNSSVSAPQVQNALGNAISSAMQGAKLLSGVKQAQADVDNTEKTGDILDQQNRKAAADASTAEAQAKNADDFYRSQAQTSQNTAYKLARDAQETEQRISNNPSGPQVTVGVPGVGEVRGTPNGVSNTIRQWISPIAPQPGYSPAPVQTTTTPSSFQRLAPIEGFAPQSLFSNP